MKKNKHIGQDFDDFLKEEGIFEEVNLTALNDVIAYLWEKQQKSICSPSPNANKNQN